MDRDYALILLLLGTVQLLACMLFIIVVTVSFVMAGVGLGCSLCDKFRSCFSTSVKDGIAIYPHHKIKFMKMYTPFTTLTIPLTEIWCIPYLILSLSLAPFVAVIPFV